MALFPREDWCLLSHLLIFHGRRACKARGGTCADDSICARFCSEAQRSARAAPRARTSPAARRAPSKGRA
jgi:endonuclease III